MLVKHCCVYVCVCWEGFLLLALVHFTVQFVQIFISCFHLILYCRFCHHFYAHIHYQIHEFLSINIDCIVWHIEFKSDEKMQTKTLHRRRNKEKKKTMENKRMYEPKECERMSEKSIKSIYQLACIERWDAYVLSLTQPAIWKFSTNGKTNFRFRYTKLL